MNGSHDTQSGSGKPKNAGVTEFKDWLVARIFHGNEDSSGARPELSDVGIDDDIAIDANTQCSAVKSNLQIVEKGVWGPVGVGVGCQCGRGGGCGRERCEESHFSGFEIQQVSGDGFFLAGSENESTGGGSGDDLRAKEPAFATDYRL